MVNDLQGDYARFVRAVKEIAQERTVIILVSICCIITVGNYFRTNKAIDAANAATAVATTWQTMYKETERECRLAQAQINDFRIALFKAGIEVEHTGETP